jgi:Uma2 family endonuclease
MTAAPKLRFTFREYLEVDEASSARHEFLDGMILGMAGGTPEHARLAAAVSTALGRQLEGKRCAVFSEALRIKGAQGFAAYPDVTVICGSLERDPENAVTVTNPAVVVEVLSPGTADYDRGEKLEQYKKVPAIQHVVLIAHDAPRITVISREAAGWRQVVAGPGDHAALVAIGCTLDVTAIFRDPLAATAS